MNRSASAFARGDRTGGFVRFRKNYLCASAKNYARFRKD
jgi:hypothetical protein